MGKLVFLWNLMNIAKVPECNLNIFVKKSQSFINHLIMNW